MQPQRWDELGDLFSQLLTLAPEQRASFMQTACSDDPELRAELASLLSAHGARGPLDAAPEILAAEGESPEAAESPGSQVGPYRLLRRLGEGGMGSVWLAERSDGSVKRSIALKRPHVRWVGGFAERALQERDILAGLAEAPEQPVRADLRTRRFGGLGRFALWSENFRRRVQRAVSAMRAQ